MNLAAVLIALPVNILILFALYKEIKERTNGNNIKQNKLDNLLTERLYINLSKEDKDMLELLSRHSRKPASQFMHCVLKEAIKKATHV